MTKFIQLSDLHIHKDNNKSDNAHCNIVVEHLANKYTSDKPVVLLTGDLVDDGHEQQYRNAVQILKPLKDKGFTLLACPGNHDYGPLGNVYTEKSQALFQEHILCELIDNHDAKQPGTTMEDLFPMVTTVGDVLFIGLDSVVGAEDQFMHFASGKVGKKQRNKLKTILKNKPSGKKIVTYFHHHPFDRRFVMEMDDARKVMRILADNTDALCFGHDHKSDIWSSNNNIDWIMASGKTTDRNSNYKFQYREMMIDGEDSNVSMVTFKKD